MIILQHLLGSFMSTIQFVSLCAFHTKIADPAIGGTYMTTLNTLSNYGGTWPRIFIYYLIDKITINKCITDKGYIMLTSEEAKEQCTYSGGKVETVRDGYFYTNALCISLGIVIFSGLKEGNLSSEFTKYCLEGIEIIIEITTYIYIYIYIHIQLL